MGLLGSKHTKEFVFGLDGVLRFRGRVYVLEDTKLKRLIFKKGFKSHFSMHLGKTKM